MPTLEEQIKALEEQLKLREKQVTDQNSYITKLESQTKQGQPNAQGGQTVDPVVQRYLEKKMRMDTIEEGVHQIKIDYAPEEFDAVHPDLLAFLNANMKKENTTVGFVVDAFDLLYGRAKKNKAHAIHQIGKATPPSGTPASTNDKAIQSAQAKALESTPPVIAGNDGTPGIPPAGTQQPVSNTNEAFKTLKNKFGQSGGGRFQ